VWNRGRPAKRSPRGAPPKRSVGGWCPSSSQLHHVNIGKVTFQNLRLLDLSKLRCCLYPTQLLSATLTAANLDNTHMSRRFLPMCQDQG
jgi:hypothetical protein